MFSSKKPKPQGRIDCLIGAGTKVTGDVTFTGGLRVDGEIKGNVQAAGDQPSTLVISEHARIEGEIHVSHLVINGTVIGPMHATELLELQPKASIIGDVKYEALEMHQGATINGELCPLKVDDKPALKLAASNAS